VLGDDAFRAHLQQQAVATDGEIPKRKRQLRHLPLAAIAGEGRDRGEWMREAYREHGYTMQQIAEHAELHHSTVSKSIKSADQNPRNKTLYLD
jgi:REP-associated tyrosine transposase